MGNNIVRCSLELPLFEEEEKQLRALAHHLRKDERAVMAYALRRLFEEINPPTPDSTPAIVFNVGDLVIRSGRMTVPHVVGSRRTKDGAQRALCGMSLEYPERWARLRPGSRHPCSLCKKAKR